MIIKKKLNNNVAIVTDERGKESIVMGKGIAFNKAKGDILLEEEIDKRFVSPNPNFSMQFQGILKDIPEKYLTVSNLIIEEAKKDLQVDLSDNIYIMLTDHIYMAVKRFLDGLFLPNPMLWDMKRFYNKEYSVGCRALRIIEEQLKVKLPEDEAGFIAFHFVNATEDYESTMMTDILKLVKEITNIVKYSLGLDVDEESIYYYRFITHLKFFAQRFFSEKEQMTGNKRTLLEMVKKQYKKAFRCTQVVMGFLEKKYHHGISEEEQLYLTVHIQNMIEKSKLDCNK